MSDPTDMTATGLLAAYRGGSLSPVEVAQALLERIDRLDGAYNAFCLVDPDTTLRQAHDSERRWSSGAPQGRLDGVPVAVKDTLATAGWPTRKGSHTSDDGPGEADAPAVAALRRHGAVLLGKTTTPEIGWKAVTDSPLTGITRNPWNPELTPGGSSGGSSAALAARMAPLALGTDGGGSIRIPSSFCNLVGLKPTFGRVPVWPPSPFGSVSHVGPMARTVTDAALLLSAIAEPDPRDWTCLPPVGSELLVDLDAGIDGWRVAVSPTLGYADVDAEVAAICGRAGEIFAQLGAIVEEPELGLSDPHDAFEVLWAAGAAHGLRHVTERAADLLDPGLAALGDHGAELTALDHLAAESERARFAAQLATLLGRDAVAGDGAGYDLLVTPSVAVPPFAAGRDVPAQWTDPRWTTWATFSVPFNLTQQPAVSVPCGFTSDGRPVGIQLIGARSADARVLRAARAFERANPLHERRPPEPAA